MAAPTALWLHRKYGKNAAAVAGSIRRILVAETNDAEALREELRRYCFAYDTTAAYDATGAYDAIESAKNEGRRQVLLHFMAIMSLTAEDLKTPEGKPDDHRADTREPDADTGNPRYANSGPHVDGFADNPAGPGLDADGGTDS